MFYYPACFRRHIFPSPLGGEGRRERSERGVRGASVILLSFLAFPGIINVLNENDFVFECAAAEPGSSSLRIETVPDGASLFINGRLTGATPVLFERLKAGVYGVRIEKEGYAPFFRRVVVGAGGVLINEALESIRTGALSLRVEPNGAEVVLDGEIVGHTPLEMSNLAAGPHELTIRKTNFDSYSKCVEIIPGGSPLTFSAFVLKDRIFAMLDGMIKKEPQRLAHDIDLAHYLFVNGKIDESADVFVKGLELMQKPLDYNVLGFSGRENMLPAEIALEEQLRKEDEARLFKEIEKHRKWPRVDTKMFSTKLDRAFEKIAREHIGDWAWVDRTGKSYVNSRKPEKAIQLYLDHLAANKKTSSQKDMSSQGLDRAYVALIDLYLKQNDLIAVKDVTAQFAEAIETSADPKICEDRSLCLADVLRRSRRFEDARELYTRLSASVNAGIRTKAKTGLSMVKADEAKGNK